MRPESPLPPELDTGPDDASVNRAFRWSLVALMSLALLAGVGYWFFKTKGGPARRPQAALPGTEETAALQIPFVQFTAITAEAGIGFVHNNGAYGEKLLPETMGGGVAFFDYDSDGNPDLLFVNSTYWPWHLPEGKKPTSLALYRNNGRGRFQDVTQGSGLEVPLYGMGAAVGDYDNDGLVDVFITAVGENRLYHNQGGRFTDATRSAGVSGSTNEWSTSSAWLDYDHDGDLDLFVSNYVQWSRQLDIEVDYRLVGVGRAYGPPMNFPGTFPYLYRNEGRGRFTDVSAEAGLHIRNPGTHVPMAKSLGVAPVDIDADDWIDLVVANDTVQNFVFLNQRNGTFLEAGAHSGIAFDRFGQTRGAMGIDAARFRNDSTLGIAIGNFANEMNALYVSQPNKVIFADEAITEGVGPASRLLLKFGLFFFDYDLDGNLDVLTANGHLEENISLVQQSQQYRQPAQLFWNRGPGKIPAFVAVPPEKCGADLFTPIVGRGSAFADIDADGDLDVILTQIAGPPLLLRNDQKLGHSWIRFQLTGTRSNRDAIGAWVQLRTSAGTASRQVMPTHGYLSQSELAVTFGLSPGETIEQVNIRWPDGSIQPVPAFQLNTLNRVTQLR